MILLWKLMGRIWALAGTRFSPSVLAPAAVMVAVTLVLFFGGDPNHPARFYSPSYYTNLSAGLGSPQQLAVLIAFPAILAIIMLSLLLSVPLFLVNPYLAVASMYLWVPPLACGVLLGYWYLVVLCIISVRTRRRGQERA